MHQFQTRQASRVLSIKTISCLAACRSLLTKALLSHPETCICASYEAVKLSWLISTRKPRRYVGLGKWRKRGFELDVNSQQRCCSSCRVDKESPNLTRPTAPRTSTGFWIAQMFSNNGFVDAGVSVQILVIGIVSFAAYILFKVKPFPLGPQDTRHSDMLPGLP